MSATGKWTEEECAAFLRGTAQYGTDWRAISSLVPTRSLVQIRSHAQKVNEKKKRHERPKVPKKMLVPEKVTSSGPWLPSEQRMFEEGLATYGKGRWKKIADAIPTRSTLQVRSHAQKFLAAEARSSARIPPEGKTMPAVSVYAVAVAGLLLLAPHGVNGADHGHSPLGSLRLGGDLTPS